MKPAPDLSSQGLPYLREACMVPYEHGRLRGGQVNQLHPRGQQVSLQSHQAGLLHTALGMTHTVILWGGQGQI